MTQKVEKQIEIDADLETVWRALTEGEEIKRWFTLDARVTPGPGGSVWMSFGEGAEWESPIEVWEPKRRFGTADTIPMEGQAPMRIAVDYYLEAKGGSTVLRLVHSGFAKDEWDDELEQLNSGWGSFLAILKLYLERHRGESRNVAFFRHPPVERPTEEIYRRTLEAVGFSADAIPAVGERFAVSTRNGDRFEGVVQVSARPLNFTATLENWNDGVLMIEIEKGKERSRPSMWVSLYGGASDRAGELQGRLTELLTGTFV